MALKVAEYPHFKELAESMAKLVSSATSFRGTLYRACEPNYANTRDLLTGDGARRYGGRWNAAGGPAIAYLSREVEGAVAETLGLAGHFGFDPASRLPLTVVAVDADLAAVLDLTSPLSRRTLGVTLTAMTTCPWKTENAAGREALTQALGRAAAAAGLNGILVPSAVKRTFRHLNVFPPNLDTKSTLSIRNASKLPSPPPPGTV